MDLIFKNIYQSMPCQKRSLDFLFLVPMYKIFHEISTLGQTLQILSQSFCFYVTLDTCIIYLHDKYVQKYHTATYKSHPINHYSCLVLGKIAQFDFNLKVSYTDRTGNRAQSIGSP